MSFIGRVSGVQPEKLLILEVTIQGNDPILTSHVPFTTYGPVSFDHMADETIYGDASDLNTMTSRILTNLKSRAAPAFLLTERHRLRQDNDDVPEGGLVPDEEDDHFEELIDGRSRGAVSRSPGTGSSP
jgi:hypothetical protein